MKNLKLQNQFYYALDSKTNMFIASGELTGDYTQIQNFEHNNTNLCIISCNDTKEIFIVR